ncbi:leukocyte elastase inhibitor-like [Seriola lalandi dorsalis]|uniref:leukocyte elastase inhibitor-like n=1 Tax=Seriola lalandi dorsalis TaxID=1841481 RepID=UPI000C6FC900|nr:leukocyte elastase inhibitor-like [Seriola lalandi dorsalis]
MAAISSSNTVFALELLRTLSQADPTGNIFVSPLSISSALAMVYLGARGDTAAQMAQVKPLIVCFIPDKIKDLLKPGTVSTMTRLALVNAIYFKGNWMNRFDEANTKEMPFKVNQNETKPVMMMYQMKKLPYNYIPDHSVQILELPYMEEELSMFILLPDESEDGSNPLLKLENELTQERLDEWTNRENMDVHSEVIIHLPKFKLEEDYELNEPLAKLGMTDVFCSAKADLSGMNGKGGLFLSTVAHKAFVEVNEEGTEAAAATAGMVAFCMLREEHFTADHPFLFFIRHNTTKSILFLGRFSSPQ